MKARQAKTEWREIFRAPSSPLRPAETLAASLAVPPLVVDACPLLCAGVFANSLHHRRGRERDSLCSSVCIGSKVRCSASKNASFEILLFSESTTAAVAVRANEYCIKSSQETLRFSISFSSGRGVSVTNSARDSNEIRVTYCFHRKTFPLYGCLLESC